MQALHHLTQLAGYNHYTTTSPTSKMGWLDGTPSRAIPPPRGTEHSVLGWDMLQAFSTRLLDLVNLGIGRQSEIRASFAYLRILAGTAWR
ncbi:hypothetical protein WA026_023271 [Henosepilachna vigintioctopunctata]|uniref:Uncharacterized protein n=1 Tax=Henosepilachna vigintioctopunctata TaxID=420089 RepID=A0AAW1V6P2_9CUCU